MRYIIIGGAGFIGSHFIDRLLNDLTIEQVTIYDNFSYGRSWHYQHHLNDLNNNRLHVICDDVENLCSLTNAIKGHDLVIHLASNPDIAKAAIQPDIDFLQGTVLTNKVLEAMRIANVKRLIYASGSGVYGDIGTIKAKENMSLLPISTYGASKLAGEALIHSYCYMFGLSAIAFRFGNVVGSRQTHGVGFDFIKKLLKDPSKLTILGNGEQSKSYIHVTDVINAVLLANKLSSQQFEVYNVATGDYITVNEIAKIVLECLNLNNVIFEYAKGWKGDVPIVRLNTDKIRLLGWKPSMLTKEAIKKSLLDMLPDILANKM